MLVIILIVKAGVSTSAGSVKTEISLTFSRCSRSNTGSGVTVGTRPVTVVVTLRVKLFV